MNLVHALGPAGRSLHPFDEPGRLGDRLDVNDDVGPRSYELDLSLDGLGDVVGPLERRRSSGCNRDVPRTDDCPRLEPAPGAPRSRPERLRPRLRSRWRDRTGRDPSGRPPTAGPDGSPRRRPPRRPRESRPRRPTAIPTRVRMRLTSTTRTVPMSVARFRAPARSASDLSVLAVRTRIRTRTTSTTAETAKSAARTRGPRRRLRGRRARRSPGRPRTRR